MNNRVCLLGAAGLLIAGAGCEIDDPCDPGQSYEGAVCLVPPEPEPDPMGMGGEAGGGMMDTAGPPADAGGLDVDGGLTTLAVDLNTDFGTPCADPVGSSDCGGTAPICLPPMGGGVCSQILCQTGEPNEGACPATMICIAPDPTQPSVCLDPAVLGG